MITLHFALSPPSPAVAVNKKQTLDNRALFLSNNPFFFYCNIFLLLRIISTRRRILNIWFIAVLFWEPLTLGTKQFQKSWAIRYIVYFLAEYFYSAVHVSIYA